MASDSKYKVPKDSAGVKEPEKAPKAPVKPPPFDTVNESYDPHSLKKLGARRDK